MSGQFNRVSVDHKQTSLYNFQERLDEAHRNEETSQQRISYLEERIKELEKLLSEEQDKNQCLTEILEGDTPPITEPISRPSDPQGTFGTVSTVLMQYKYDEMQHTNQRYIQAYCRKDKEFKELSAVNETLRNENEQLKDKERALYMKIQELCYRYLHYKTKRDSEIFNLRVNFENAIEVVHELRSKSEHFR